MWLLSWGKESGIAKDEKNIVKTINNSTKTQVIREI